LSSNNVRVIERGNACKTVLLFPAVGFFFGGIEIVSMKDNTTAKSSDIQVFDRWGAGGHDNGSRNFELAGRVRDTLSMIAYTI
jgi:hypothetical protein